MYRGVPELVPNGTRSCPQGCDVSVFRRSSFFIDIARYEQQRATGRDSRTTKESKKPKYQSFDERVYKI